MRYSLSDDRSIFYMSAFMFFYRVHENMKIKNNRFCLFGSIFKNETINSALKNVRAMSKNDDIVNDSLFSHYPTGILNHIEANIIKHVSF